MRAHTRLVLKTETRRSASTFSGGLRLLPCKRGGELAVAHAHDKTFDEFGNRVLAIGSYQFGKGGKQACLCQAIAIDPVMSRFGPGFAEIAESGLLLLVIGQEVAGDEGRRMAHECAAVLGGEEQLWCSTLNAAAKTTSSSSLRKV